MIGFHTSILEYIFFLSWRVQVSYYAVYMQLMSFFHFAKNKIRLEKKWIIGTFRVLMLGLKEFGK